MSSAVQAVSPFVTAGLTRLRLPQPPAAEPVPSRRPRARLWQLTGSLHCSIIGTCLTTAELRRTLGKVARVDISHLGDHDLHTQAVTLCGQHNASSKLLHKALDDRHMAVIKRLARVEGEAAVMRQWDEARREGDIPGTYWALLTHPDVGYDGLRRAFNDVHMLSHLVGAANRADIRRLAALEAENAELRAKVERQQQRLQDAITSRDATIRRLGSLAAGSAGRVAEVAPDDALEGLRHLAADLQARLAREAGGRERLERRLAAAAESARLREGHAREAEARCLVLQQELALIEGHHDGSDPGPSPGLPAQTILYVGGRPGCVEQIRACLEAAGGALLCHDGGRHDHPSLLAGLIGRADRVAFPVDCVSHDAALTVKRLCRQLGKPWLPLRSSGFSSFLGAVAGPGHAVSADDGLAPAG